MNHKQSAANRRDVRRNGDSSEHSTLSKAQGKRRKMFSAWAYYAFSDEGKSRNPFVSKHFGNRNVKLGNYKTRRAAQQSAERERSACPFKRMCVEIRTWVEDAS